MHFNLTFVNQLVNLRAFRDSLLLFADININTSNPQQKHTVILSQTNKNNNNGSQVKGDDSTCLKAAVWGLLLFAELLSLHVSWSCNFRGSEHRRWVTVWFTADSWGSEITRTSLTSDINWRFGCSRLWLNSNTETTETCFCLGHVWRLSVPFILNTSDRVS